MSQVVDLVGLIVGVCLLVYLLAVLANPERF